MKTNVIKPGLFTKPNDTKSEQTTTDYDSLLFNEVMSEIIMTILPVSLDSGIVQTPRLAFIEKLKNLLVVCTLLSPGAKYREEDLMWKPFLEKCDQYIVAEQRQLTNELTLELANFALQIQNEYSDSIRQSFNFNLK